MSEADHSRPPQAGNGPTPPASGGFDLVCVSHLWWDWVWQRPQHLMTRFARRGASVTYVEEPRIEIGPPAVTFDLVEAEDGVRIARLAMSTDAAEFRRRLDESRRSLGGHPFDIGPDVRIASLLFESALQPTLEAHVRDRFNSRPRTRPLVLWLYTPSAVQFIDLVDPDVVVYDVMDDLTAFRFAPQALRDQRDELVTKADLIFTGGPSLHAGVASLRPDAVCLPSAVDVGHFATARGGTLPVPAPIADVEGPIAGYIGVIDERIDLELLEAAARATPDWTWLMVGPVLKIETRMLPSRPNLRFVGQVSYWSLPAWLAAFDVGIMPFAANEATRAISPTKTLEYLAAGLPVVSTPIADVVSLYGNVVDTAADVGSFVDAVTSADTGAGPPDRRAAIDALLAAASWDATADRMFDTVSSRVERDARTVAGH